MDLPKNWNAHLRRESQKSRSNKVEVKCPLCRQAIQGPQDSEAIHATFQGHIVESHSQALQDMSSEEKLSWIQSQLEAAYSQEKLSWIQSQFEAAVPPARPSSRTKPVGPGPPAAASEDRPSKSPTPKREGSTSRSVSPPKRSRARPAPPVSPGVDDSRADFARGPYQKGTLWDPEDDTAAPPPRPYDKSNVATYHRQRHSTGAHPKPHRQAHPSAASGSRAPGSQPADNDATEMIYANDFTALCPCNSTMVH
ncbi:hypothetical protein VTG60DRAFT_2820 [Thermothelomyces hinnuleus]